MYGRAFCIRSSIKSPEPATKAPNEPNAFPNVPTNTGTSSLLSPEMFHGAATACAEHA